MLQAISEAQRECAAYGGRFTVEDGFDTRLALNSDAAPDHVLNYGAAACEGAGEDYDGAARGGYRDNGCGRNGCRVEVFLSGSGGHRKVFSEPVWTAEINRETAPARLRFSASTMPGCEASYAEGCHAEWGWNGQAFAHLRFIDKSDMAWMQPLETDAATGSDAAIQGEAEVRALMAAIFERPRGTTSMWPDQIYTPDMQRFMDAGEDGEGYWGADPLTGGQDWTEVRHRVDRIEMLGDDGAVAEVAISVDDGDWWSRNFFLKKIAGSWLIDDWAYEGASFRSLW